MPKINASFFVSPGYNRQDDNARMLIYDGKKIVELRLAKGWNQSKLAKESGIKQPSIWALEHEETKMPKFETLQKVAAALGVPVRDILRKTASAKQLAAAGEDLLTVFEGLSSDNKVALVAAAKALLDSQKRR